MSRDDFPRGEQPQRPIPHTMKKGTFCRPRSQAEWTAILDLADALGLGLPPRLSYNINRCVWRSATETSRSVICEMSNDAKSQTEEMVCADFIREMYDLVPKSNALDSRMTNYSGPSLEQVAIRLEKLEKALSDHMAEVRDKDGRLERFAVPVIQRLRRLDMHAGFWERDEDGHPKSIQSEVDAFKKSYPSSVDEMFIKPSEEWKDPYFNTADVFHTTPDECLLAFVAAGRITPHEMADLYGRSSYGDIAEFMRKKAAPSDPTSMSSATPLNNPIPIVVRINSDPTSTTPPTQNT